MKTTHPDPGVAANVPRRPDLDRGEARVTKEWAPGQCSSRQLLVGVLLAIALGQPGLADDPKPPRGERAAEMLTEGRKLLEAGQVTDGVRKLRQVTRRYRRTDAGRTAVTLLAKRGFGSRFRVIFDEPKSFARLGITLEAVVGSLDAKVEPLVVFFSQTYDAARRLEDFEVIVSDSRARFRKRFAEAEGRSTRRKFSEPGREIVRVASYFDPSIANRRDRLDVLERSLLREIAGLLLEARTAAPLPDAIREGLCDYLSTALFERKLAGLAQTQRGILGSFGREGLALIADFPDFRLHLEGPSPEGETSRRVLWKWRGVSFAIVDTLLTRDSPDATAHALKLQRFQAVLRDYDRLLRRRRLATRRGRAKLFEELCEHHLARPPTELHRAVLERAGKYPPLEPDYQGITD